MTPEILFALLKTLPDGKTIMPIQLTIDKLGSSVIMNIQISIHGKVDSMLPLQKNAVSEEDTIEVHSLEGSPFRTAKRL